MSRETAIMHALCTAKRKGMAVYVLATADGYRVASFCDECPQAVAFVVGATGVIWSAE